MNPQQPAPQKGFSTWALHQLRVPISTRNVLIVRLLIIALCAIGIIFLHADRNSAEEYGNFNEMQELYPELFNQ